MLRVSEWESESSKSSESSESSESESFSSLSKHSWFPAFVWHSDIFFMYFRYVKLYLMPGKKKKKKTSVVKDSGNPRFDEEFDFDVDMAKLADCSIQVGSKTLLGWETIKNWLIFQFPRWRRLIPGGGTK